MLTLSGPYARSELPAEERQFIKTNILLSGLAGEATDHYWTNAWATYRENPGEKSNHDMVTTKLKNLYRHLMNLPGTN